MSDKPWEFASYGAIFSKNREHRFTLWRVWDKQRSLCCFICLNPSTADEAFDDPTVKKCIGFANTLGYGGILLGNLFAYRATLPKDLMRAADPIGEENDDWLRRMSAAANETIVAWGNHGARMNRSRNVDHLFSPLLSCFGYTKLGEPKHPLYLPYDAPMFPYGVGKKFIRDGHAICKDFIPNSEGVRVSAGCQTDGHYICSECAHRDFTADAPAEAE